MKKTNISKFKLILIVTILLLFPTYADATNDISVVLENQKLEFDVQPQIIEGRTMLPLRAIFEALGLEVGWDQETRTITGISDSKTIILKVGDSNAFVDGVTKTIDVSPLIIDGRTLVPVRFIAENLGMNVVWDQEILTVKISRDDIIEWKYEGYEAVEPFKEYERKYVNGIITEETRYNGNNHVLNTVNLYSVDGRIIPNVREDKIPDYGSGWYTKSPLVGKTYWIRLNSFGRYVIKNPNTGQDYPPEILDNHKGYEMYIKVRIDEHYYDKEFVTNGKEIGTTDSFIKCLINDKIEAVILTYRITGQLQAEIAPLYTWQAGTKYTIFDKDPRTIFNWSEAVWKDLGEGKKWIGMTKDMLIVSIGSRPTRVNSTVTKYSVSEQWVYDYGTSIPSSYYYFENGKLVAWQH